MKYGTVDDLRCTVDVDSSAEVSPLWYEAPSKQASLLARRYEIQGLLGSGGAGSVFRARDLVLGEDIALKILKRVGPTPGEALEHLRNEVRLARRVTHRSIARVYDLVEHEGFYFLTMEYIDGLSLAKRLGRSRSHQRKLPLAEVITLASQIAEGLSAAHLADVVHCDLKPENVLLSRDGRTILTDFGIARTRSEAPESEVTPSGMSGTPAYMSPEQVSGGTVDGRSDLYALGVMMFEMLSGRLPFQGETGKQVAMARHLEDPPDLGALCPELPQEATAAVNRCLQRRREDRFNTAEELRRALLSIPLSVDQQSCRAVLNHSFDLDATLVLPAENRLRVVAVSLLQNHGDAAQSYIAQGLTDSLTDAISSLRDTRVVSSAVLAKQAHHGDLLAAAKAAGAHALVSGAIRMKGQHLLAVLRMVSVEGGFQIWTHKWEIPFGEAIGLCQQATRAIASALSTDVSAQLHDTTLDPETLDLYLRARHLYTGTDPSFFRRSVELLEQALARQPNSPLLLAGYAKAAARSWFWGHEEDRVKATHAAERAVQAAPHQGSPYAAQAAVLYGSGDLPGAVRSLQRALTLSPQLADAHDLLGRILSECGPLSDSVAHLETALRIDPTLPRAWLDIVRVFAMTGVWKQVEAILDREISDPRLVPMWWMMAGRMGLWRQDPQWAKHLLSMPSDESSGCKRGKRLLLRMADPEGSGRFTREEQHHFFQALPNSNARRRTVLHQGQAELYCLDGRFAEALHAIQESIDDGLTDQMWMDFCPLLKPLRSEPKFLKMRAEVAGHAEHIRATWGITSQDGVA